MNVAESPSEVSADELLARYVLTRRHVREDGTIKPDALAACGKIRWRPRRLGLWLDARNCGGGDAKASSTTHDDADSHKTGVPCGLRRDADHLLRCRSSAMLWHRVVTDALHLATSRSQRDPMEFFHRLLMPHPHTDLSVSRHALATIEGIWKYGQLVAQQRERELIGRADLHTMSCLDLHLRVKAAPLPDNPSHANVTSWPPDKKEQKRIAIQLAATAVYVRYAPETLGSGPE